MQITRRQFGDVVVLDLHGPMAGRRAAGMLASAVRLTCRTSGSTVVANLGGVRSVNIGGLGALVDADATVRRAGGVFKLAGITKPTHDLVVMTRRLAIFDAYDSVAAAVGRPQAEEGQR
jgi:anti-anti-sigma factor